MRSDLNLSPAHRLSVRHNQVGATADVGSQSNFRYRFTDNFYPFESRTDSTVAQLNSTFGAAFNLARVSFQRIRDRRGPRTAPFPQVTIDLEGGEDIRFGTEQFSTANAFDQDIIEIHNDLTSVRGRRWRSRFYRINPMRCRLAASTDNATARAKPSAPWLGHGRVLDAAVR